MKDITELAAICPPSTWIRLPSDSLPTDTRRLVRIGLWVDRRSASAASCVWAAFAPLDEGVPTSGVVSVDTKRKAVQHQQGGIVREVLVREGQMVEANQVVMRLDDAVARANYESSRQRYLGLRAHGRTVAGRAAGPADDRLSSRSRRRRRKRSADPAAHHRADAVAAVASRDRWPRTSARSRSRSRGSRR